MLSLLEALQLKVIASPQLEPLLRAWLPRPQPWQVPDQALMLSILQQIPCPPQQRLCQGQERCKPPRCQGFKARPYEQGRPSCSSQGLRSCIQSSKSCAVKDAITKEQLRHQACRHAAEMSRVRQLWIASSSLHLYETLHASVLHVASRLMARLDSVRACICFLTCEPCYDE